jgi:hypothetical protein
MNDRCAHPGELLTDEEKELLATLGHAARLFRQIVADDTTRDADLSEVVDKIHQLQHAVLAQAAGRYYPDDYRLLGGT